MIEQVEKSLAERTNEVHLQIGLDMRALRQRVAELETCCDKHKTNQPLNIPDSDHQPNDSGDAVFTLDNITYINAEPAPPKLKRDIKMIPTGEYGLMDMALTADGDLLHDTGLETAVLMALFSDMRHENERGFWADELIGRETGSHLWLLKREKTTSHEHKEGSVLRRAEDYCKAALKWMTDDGTAESFTVAASWSGDNITERMLLKIAVYLPSGSRFIGY